MRIRVDGEPIAVRTKKKPSRVAWQNAVADKCRERLPLPEGTYRVRLDFVLPPASYQRKNKQSSEGKDLDNLVSPVFDALTETLLVSAGGDSKIVELFATKRPGEDPGVQITIVPRKAGSP